MQNQILLQELAKAGHKCKITDAGVLVLEQSKNQRLGLSIAALNLRFNTKIFESKSNNLSLLKTESNGK